MEELDWSAGCILDAVERCDIAERTLLIWTSDNGAVKWDPSQGSNEPLRGWGYDTSEGAQRVPFVARLPGTIPEGSVCREVASMMDLLPTLVGLAGIEVPRECQIDGFDMLPLLRRDGTPSPYDERGFFYYYMDQLQAVRAGRWKLYLPLESKIISSRNHVSMSDLTLYDLDRDVSEEMDRSGKHPEIVEKLMALADAARSDLGDLGRRGRCHRAAGWVEHPVLPFQEG
jgi:arylsulfatase A-like enzyme